MKNMRRFGDIFVSDASFYEQFNFHIERTYRRSPRRRETRMQEAVLLMERQRGGQRHTICTEPGSSLQSVVRRKTFRGMEKGARLFKPI